MATMFANEPTHIMVRFSDAFMSVEDTIAEHQAVIKKFGHVWFAKVGKPLGGRHIAKINQQCGQGVPSFLILVQNKGRPGSSNYVGSKCKILEVREQLPETERKFIPGYYLDQNVLNAATLWVKTSDIRPMAGDGLGKFRIASSQKSAPQALRTSMAAIFVVQEGKGVD